MPELAKPWLLFAMILNSQRNSKSPGSPLVQMRKVLIFSGSSAVVLPIMAPSWTDHSFGFPIQPARSLPLNIGWKPASESAAKAARTSTRPPRAIDQTAVAQAADLLYFEFFIMSYAKISGL